MTGETALRSAVEALLAEERRAIRAGDLGALGGLALRKADAIDRLAAEVPSDAQEFLARIRELAFANQTLLAAALDGVRSARARLTAILDAGSRLDSYDEAGRARTVSFAQGTIERRA